MKNPLSFLRAVVWLKRTAINTERCAEALETIAMIYAQQHVPRSHPKITEFGTFDQQEANKKWEEFIKERGETP